MTKAELKVADRIMCGKLNLGAQEPKAWSRAIGEIVDLRAALEHTMACECPIRLQLRCEGCVKAEALLRR